MDPQFDREPALRLPQPMPDQGSWQAPAIDSHEQAAAFEVGPQASQGAPALATTPSPVMQQPAQQLLQVSPTPPISTAAQTTAATGDDPNDERLWVERAKRIVEQTHTDPYLESQEIGKFKAEYLKDVHAKNIKVAEG